MVSSAVAALCGIGQLRFDNLLLQLEHTRHMR
jgi:hypothetical protein